jgi:hypothetical protein
MHRGIPERGLLWRLGRQVVLAAVILGTASALFILFSLALRGHVSW